MKFRSKKENSRSYGLDVKVLARRLIECYSIYFSRDMLNSEGRKVFEEMARMLVYEHPEYKKLVKRVRRKPTLDNVLRIVERLLDEDVYELLRGAVEGPYAYWSLEGMSQLKNSRFRQRIAKKDEYKEE